MLTSTITSYPIILKCLKCQTLIVREGSEDEDDLQSYFIRRIETFINSKPRKYASIWCSPVFAPWPRWHGLQQKNRIMVIS